MCTKKASKIFCTKSAHTMLVKLPPDWVRSLKHKFPYSQRSVSNDVTLLRTDIFCDNNMKLSVRCFLNICCSRHTHYATPMCLNRSKIQIVRIGGASYGTLCVMALPLCIKTWRKRVNIIINKHTRCHLQTHIRRPYAACSY